MQSVSFSVSGLKDFSKKLNEPEWLFEYRKKNEGFFRLEKLKKSPYYNILVAKNLLQASLKEQKPQIPRSKIDGVRFLSWPQALNEFEAQIKLALESEHEPKDQFEAFINAWFNGGFVVVVDKSVQKQKPVIFESFLEKDCAGKVLVIVKDAVGETSFIEKIGARQSMLLNETIWTGEKNSVFFLRECMNSNDSQVLLYQQAIVQRDSFLLNSNGWLDGGFLRSNTFNMLAGQGSQAEHLDFLLLGGNQIFDINNSAVHSACDSKSYTQMRAVLFGHAKNVFDGMIKILPSGQRTNALLEAHSMLLSMTASSNNIPGLEIEADDVKATHSASVAQVLEEQVFYLESRGIKKGIARQLIVTSFLESVVLRLPVEFQEHILGMLDQKMSLLGKVKENA